MCIRFQGQLGVATCCRHRECSAAPDSIHHPKRSWVSGERPLEQAPHERMVTPRPENDHGR
jgi:hypothetical protein